MKSYTTKANAKRAAKTIQANLHDRIESIRFDHTFEGDKGYGIFVTLTSDNTREDWKAIAEQFPNAQFSLRLAEPTPAEKPVKVVKRKSEIESPCRATWDIAESMPGARRKDVIEACVKSGIAFYTARTQYQQWKKAMAAADTEENA